MIYRPSRSFSALNFKLLFAATLVLSLATTACTQNEKSQRSRVAVQVNERTLTAGEFSDRLARRLKDFTPLMARDSAIVAQIKNSIVQDFVVLVITESWAKKNEIFVRKEYLEEEIEKLRSSYADDIAFRKTLASEGLTYEKWVGDLTQTLLARLVAEELRKKIKSPSKEDVAEVYQGNKDKYQITPAIRLRQIVLENQHNAELVQKEIRAGKSLAKLAKEYSITPEGKLGGEIGWVERGALPVFDAAFRLGVGQKSRVQKSPFGYHIIEVLEKRAGRALKLEEARALIERELLEVREQEYYSQWLEEQLSSARVFKDDNLINAIQVYYRGE